MMTASHLILRHLMPHISVVGYHSLVAMDRTKEGEVWRVCRIIFTGEDEAVMHQERSSQGMIV
jgi:hypothetical protein